MPIEKESEKIDKSSDIESLRQSLNSFYIDIIRNAQTAQQKFPLNNRENQCSRDNLLCYLALREYDLSDLQLELAEHGLSTTATDAKLSLAKRSQLLLGRPREGRKTRIMVTG